MKIFRTNIAVIKFCGGMFLWNDWDNWYGFFVIVGNSIDSWDSPPLNPLPRGES